MALLNAPHQILVVSGNDLPDVGYIGDLFFKSAAPGIGWWYRGPDNTLVYWGPRLSYVGAWDPATTYNQGDVVVFAGTSYVAVDTNTNEIPPNATYWGSIAVQGAQGAQGFPGVDGDDGEPGPQGPPGNAGASGAAGADGAMGPAGLTVPGADGDDGEPGSPGPPGSQGPPGATGAAGSAGAAGPIGPQGYTIPGVDGSDGEAGQVIPGPRGFSGVSGAAGVPGLDGDDGSDGFPGSPGATGATGATGSPGATGATGPQGVAVPGFDGEDGDPGQVIPGPRGASGASGIIGPPGVDGEDGEPTLLGGSSAWDLLVHANLTTAHGSTIREHGQSTIVQRDASGNFSAGTITAAVFFGDLSGIATGAAYAGSVSITDDTTSVFTMYPAWSPGIGSASLGVSTTKLSFVPSHRHPHRNRVLWAAHGECDRELLWVGRERSDWRTSGGGNVGFWLYRVEHYLYWWCLSGNAAAASSDTGVKMVKNTIDAATTPQYGAQLGGGFQAASDFAGQFTGMLIYNISNTTTKNETKTGSYGGGLVGLTVYVKKEIGGTTSQATALLVGNGANTGTTITTAEGIALYQYPVAGAVGTWYGIKFPSSLTNVTTKYSIYSADTAQTMYHLGPVQAGKFGCNCKTPQTAYASGGAAGGTPTLTTGYGFVSAAEMNAHLTLVENMRLALVANGILS